MRLALIALAVLLVGCQQQPRDLQPVVAAYGAYTMLTASNSPDKPDAGECSNCSGTGKIGDGRVFIDCPVCGGDGVMDADDQAAEHDPIAVDLDDLPEAAPPTTKTKSVICKDGTCTLR